MAICKNGHTMVSAGHLIVRWCPEDGRFYVKAWVSADREGGYQLVTPDWQPELVLEDDEWLGRTLTKLVCAAAATAQLMEADERRGVMRLL